MNREAFRDLKAGAMDALRTYAVLIAMPFNLAKRLVARAAR